MPLGGGLRLLLVRLLNEISDKQLAESRFMRRVAQLTIYQWSKASEWASNIESRHSSAVVRIAKRFFTNLQNELKKIQGPRN